MAGQFPDDASEEFSTFLSEQKVQAVRSITLSLVEEYKACRRTSILKKKAARGATSLALDAAVLHRVFSFAMTLKIVRENPVVMEGTPGSVDADHTGAQPFESEELLKMRQAAAGKNFLIFTLLRNTGLRRSDAVKLTWAEIDFRSKIIRRKTQKRGKVVEIPLKPELHITLEFERDQREPKSYDVVLLNPATGKPLSPRKLTARIRALGTRVGIQRATPHRFRDTFAVDLLYKGMDIYTVAKVLADTVGVVEKHYARFTTALRASARQIMLSGMGLEATQFSTQSELNFTYNEEKKEVVAAGPVSRILPANFRKL